MKNAECNEVVTSTLKLSSILNIHNSELCSKISGYKISRNRCLSCYIDEVRSQHQKPTDYFVSSTFTTPHNNVYKYYLLTKLGFRFIFEKMTILQKIKLMQNKKKLFFNDSMLSDFDDISSLDVVNEDNIYILKPDFKSITERPVVTHSLKVSNYLNRSHNNFIRKFHVYNTSYLSLIKEMGLNPDDYFIETGYCRVNKKDFFGRRMYYITDLGLGMIFENVHKLQKLKVEKILEEILFDVSISNNVMDVIKKSNFYSMLNKDDERYIVKPKYTKDIVTDTMYISEKTGICHEYLLIKIRTKQTGLISRLKEENKNPDDYFVRVQGRSNVSYYTYYLITKIGLELLIEKYKPLNTYVKHNKLSLEDLYNKGEDYMESEANKDTITDITLIELSEKEKDIINKIHVEYMSKVYSSLFIAKKLNTLHSIVLTTIWAYDILLSDLSNELNDPSLNEIFTKSKFIDEDNVEQSYYICNKIGYDLIRINPMQNKENLLFAVNYIRKFNEISKEEEL